MSHIHISWALWDCCRCEWWTPPLPHPSVWEKRMQGDPRLHETWKHLLDALNLSWIWSTDTQPFCANLSNELDFWILINKELWISARWSWWEIQSQTKTHIYTAWWNLCLHKIHKSTGQLRELELFKNTSSLPPAVRKMWKSITPSCLYAEREAGVRAS